MKDILIKPHFIDIFKQENLTDREGNPLPEEERVFLYALRNKNTGKLIEVAYSEEGLKWATVSKKIRNNIVHEYVYYKKAKPELVVDSLSTHNVEGIKVMKANKRLEMKGDLTRNPKYYVEYPFLPRNHELNGQIRRNNQLRELMYSRKALKLLMDQQSFVRALQYRKAKELSLEQKELAA
jgi:hypothetical protein